MDKGAMLACCCLNVIVETAQDDFAKVKQRLEDLALTPDEAKDPLFKQEVYLIQKVGRIRFAHASLVDCRNAGSWQIYHCLNCKWSTHAIHRQKGGSPSSQPVLVNSKLLNGQNINELKRSSYVSNVFDIIVDTDKADEESTYDYLPAELELAISNIKQRANDFINRESAATEERVRLFTEQQMSALEECTKQVIKEQRALTRILVNSKCGLTSAKAPGRTSMDTAVPLSSSASPTSINKAVHTPNDAIIVPEENNANIFTKQQNKVNMNVDNAASTPERKLLHKVPLSQKSSFDAEGLFELEDMDNSDGYLHPDDDLSDIEDKDKDSDVYITIRQNSNNAKPVNMMAKSLPMTIPVFLNPFLNRENEEQEDALQHPEDPMDIAASIKALARSVHGDTVFGDLPRPRCSTNI